MRIILLCFSLLAVFLCVNGEFENLKRASEAKRNAKSTDRARNVAIYHDFISQRVDNFNWQNQDRFFQVSLTNIFEIFLVKIIFFSI